MEQNFWDHLDELRKKLIYCVYVFFAGFIAFYLISPQLLDFLRKPLFDLLPPDKRHLYYTGLFENFFIHLHIACYGALIFLSPLYFLILWSFIGPGLHEHERKKVLPFVIAGSLFFLMGSAFAYFVLFPAGFKFFLSYGSSAEVAWLTLENYVNLVTKMLFGFGAAFELPVIIVLLAKLGLLTAELLKKQRRLAFIAITLVSALVAPPDAMSMLFLMVPLYLLFEGALFVVSRIEKKKLNTTQS